ncbi:hypothetical protein VTI74DRAFT_6889 [Chaetomium olivicolor]
MQYVLGAAVGVGLGFSEPEDWPPVFGSLADCYTVGHVWGKFWHQYIRQPCLGISFFIVEKLHIPRRSIFAYFVHLLVAFVISDFFHVMSVGTVAGGYYPLENLIADFSAFFLLQTAAGTAEAFIIGFFSQFLKLSTEPITQDPSPKQQLGPETGTGLASDTKIPGLF